MAGAVIRVIGGERTTPWPSDTGNRRLFFILSKFTGVANNAFPRTKGVLFMSEKELEERVRQLEVRQAMIEQRLDTVSQDVKEIKTILSRLNWLLISAIVVAGLNLIIQTGVN